MGVLVFFFQIRGFIQWFFSLFFFLDFRIRGKTFGSFSVGDVIVCSKARSKSQ